MNSFRNVVILLLCLYVIAPAHGETAEEIVKSVHLMGDGENVTMRVRMDISTELGTKGRVLAINTKKDDRSWMVLTRVLEPVFLSELKYLYHKYTNGTERRWLKTSEGVRSLGRSGGNVRLFDSDFTVDDFSFVDTEDHDVRILDKTDGEIYTIETISRMRRDVTPKRVLEIDAKANLLLKVDYFDPDNRLVRTYTLIETDRTLGYLMPKKCTMENYSRGTKTTLFFDSMESGQDLPYRLFNQAGL